MIKIYKPSKIPTIDEYISGLTAIKTQISDSQVRLLQQQYYAIDHKIAATELAVLAEIKSGRGTVNLLYGRLGRIFCEAIGFEPDQREVGTHRWWSIWSTGYEDGNKFFWQMHPEVAEALEILGWVSPHSEVSKSLKLYPDEIEETKIYREGTVKQILVNSYERDSQARSECIKQYGLDCSICGFNFSQVFGELGKGFIHVHHLKPISEIGEEYVIDPIKDLRPVCPNCHAMIHRSSSLLSIEELKKIIQEQSV